MPKLEQQASWRSHDLQLLVTLVTPPKLVTRNRFKRTIVLTEVSLVFHGGLGQGIHMEFEGFGLI